MNPEEHRWNCSIVVQFRSVVETIINKKYLVCVRCYTYNQSQYINDTLNGFVMQQTSFPFVCTIVDDASNDGEQETIKRFLEDNFELHDFSVAYEKDADYGHVTFAQNKTNKNCYFAVIYLKENHYSKKKGKARYLIEWNNAKFMALCEGDDYWTDPLKLQKQVDYLEKHEDCCMCCHATDWKTNDVVYKQGCQHEFSCDLTTEEIIRNGGLYVATNSLVYRSWIKDDRPEWRVKSSVGDFPLKILGTLRGKMHFLPDVMGVYRYMREGSWTANHDGSVQMDQSISLNYAKNKVLWLNLLDKDTDYKYTGVIYSHLFRYYNVLFNAKEIGFSEYYRAARKADEKHTKRVFRDFMIRYLSPFHKIWLHLVGKTK